MKSKIIQQYTEKLGVPPSNENDRDQVILDLQMLGVASPSFGAAHTLNLLIHGSEKSASTAQTLQIQEAIKSQTRAFMTDEATAAAELLYGQVAILNATFNRYMPKCDTLCQHAAFWHLFWYSDEGTGTGAKDVADIAWYKKP